ncbi:hypothetical protein E2C01_063498 [Portunus trituberculatus]|uniref:Uncharacterized protein n=1 Tax=Portunus trituberculatus TaxID=210409 RepID=A0A5B7HAM1_PORTR|nr:hypothetical protein [Portunus trituberculatus]
MYRRGYFSVFQRFLNQKSGIQAKNTICLRN